MTKYAHVINKTLLGWYDSEIHSKIPEPNVNVSESVWQEAIDVNANYYDGKVFSYKEPSLTKEQQTSLFKSKRNSALTDVDFYQLALVYTELTAKQKKELKAYRLALLDSTKTQILPTKPDWFK